MSFPPPKERHLSALFPHCKRSRCLSATVFILFFFFFFFISLFIFYEFLQQFDISAPQNSLDPVSTALKLKCAQALLPW
jgi:hypothetical protein